MSLFGRPLNQKEKEFLVLGALPFVEMQKDNMYKNVEEIEFGFTQCLPEILNSRNVKKIIGKTWEGLLYAYVRFDILLDFISRSDGIDSRGRENIRIMQENARLAAELLRRIIMQETSFRPKEYDTIYSEQLDDFFRKIEKNREVEEKPRVISRKMHDNFISGEGLATDCQKFCLSEARNLSELLSGNQNSNLAKCYAVLIHTAKKVLSGYNENAINEIDEKHYSYVEGLATEDKAFSEALKNAFEEHRTLWESIESKTSFDTIFGYSENEQMQKTLLTSLLSLEDLVNPNNFDVALRKLFEFHTDIVELHMQNIGIHDMIMPTEMDTNSWNSILLNFVDAKKEQNGGGPEKNTGNERQPKEEYESYREIINGPHTHVYNALVNDIRAQLDALISLASELYDSRKALYDSFLPVSLPEALFFDFLDYMIWLSSLDGKVADKEALTIYDVFKSKDITRSFIEDEINKRQANYDAFETMLPGSFIALLFSERQIQQSGQLEPDTEYVACNVYYHLLKSIGKLIIASDNDITEIEMRRHSSFLKKIEREFKKETGRELE